MGISFFYVDKNITKYRKIIKKKKNETDVMDCVMFVNVKLKYITENVLFYK